MSRIHDGEVLWKDGYVQKEMGYAMSNGENGVMAVEVKPETHND